MPNVELFSRRGGSVNHGFSVFGRQRDGLFAKDVFPALKAFDCRLSVLIGRQADVDHVNVRVGDHVVQFRIRRVRRHVNHFALRTEVAFDFRPVASQTVLTVLFAKRHNLNVWNLLIGKVMNPAHKSNAGNANS